MPNAEAVAKEIVNLLSNKTPGAIVMLSEIEALITTFAAQQVREAKRGCWEEAIEHHRHYCAEREVACAWDIQASRRSREGEK